MSKQKSFIFYFTVLIVTVGLFSLSGIFSTVQAAACSLIPDSAGIANVTTSCNIPTDSTVYVDYAASEGSTTNNSVVQVNNSTLTISPGSNTTTTLYLGSLKVGAGGAVVIGSASQMKVGSATAFYLTDADGDGWAANFTYYTSTASGRRRASLMNSLGVPDCNDAVYNTNNICCSGNGVTCTADANCCSAICGTDSDNDGQFSSTLGHTGTCQATSKPYNDCYDSNANAYAGQSAYFTSSRGDGSYDYDCNGSETKSSSTYNTGACGSSGCEYTTLVEWTSGSTQNTPGCGGSYNTLALTDESKQGNQCYSTTCGAITSNVTRYTSCH